MENQCRHCRRDGWSLELTCRLMSWQSNRYMSREIDTQAGRQTDRQAVDKCQRVCQNIQVNSRLRYVTSRDVINNVARLTLHVINVTLLHCVSETESGPNSVSAWQTAAFALFNVAVELMKLHDVIVSDSPHTLNNDTRPVWCRPTMSGRVWRALATCASLLAVRACRQDIVICPIAIAYSMGQIIKSVCVCVSVCLSVCGHSHGRISWSILTKIGTDVKNPKKKNEFVRGSISHHPFPYFVPQNPHFRPRALENPCKY